LGGGPGTPSHGHQLSFRRARGTLNGGTGGRETSMEKRPGGADDRDAALGPAPSALLGLALGAGCPTADFFDSGEA